VSYALQTLGGLARLHAAGIVHRDVKPANLLLTDQDRIKITDLGLSKVRGEYLPERPGLKVGSPYYTAPEQEDDPDRAGPRADLYSLGVTLFRMLLGRAPLWPFRGDNRASLVNSDLDQAWDDFFDRSLSPRPEDRPETARDMARELEGLLTAWQQRLDKACQDYSASAPPQAGSAKPRRQPLKVSGRQARQIFDLDELWRPRRPTTPRFERQGPVLLDRAMGLLWQAGASDYALSWPQALDYPGELNAKGFAGAAGWRLPTVSELATILAPVPRFTGHCLAPEFDPAKRLMWSADRRTFTQAWFADADMGAVCWADMTCRLWARAVCSA
jgi:serine/threonine-protein kinase